MTSKSAKAAETASSGGLLDWLGGGDRMTERQKNRDAESGRVTERKNARESNRAIKKSQKKDRKTGDEREWKEERSCCLLAAWLVGTHRVCSGFCRASVAPVFPINLSLLWQPPAAAS